MKNFHDDFDKFFNKIKNHEPFALSRNNDGEMIILFNEFINLTKKYNGEFLYNPNKKKHSFFRNKLLEAAQYKDDNYYVGIACRCCVGDEKHEKLKKLTEQDEDHLTWGNIFVNSNYPKFCSKIIPIFNEYNIVMITNKKAKIKLLPFSNKIVKKYYVGTNAWMKNYKLLFKLNKWIKKNNVKNHLFLIAAGPFTNILINEAYKTSKNNTYLDIGSTMDSMMGLGKTRGYLKGSDTLKKVCIW